MMTVRAWVVLVMMVVSHLVPSCTSRSSSSSSHDHHHYGTKQRIRRHVRKDQEVPQVSGGSPFGPQ